MNKNIILAPESVIDSNGVACGDHLVINSYVEDSNFYFSFHGQSCNLAMSVAKDLELKLSGKNILHVKKEVQNIIDNNYFSYKKLFHIQDINRHGCLSLPVELLLKAAEKSSITIKSCDNNQGISLACDACVSTKNFQWKNESKVPPTINTARKIVSGINSLDDSREILFQKLGLCILSKEEQKIFLENLTTISDEDMKLIKKLRLAVPFYNNANKYNLKLDSKIIELAVKQIVSLNIANTEINIIDDYINNKKLKVSKVKGGVTNTYYPKDTYRVHMDFDYLAYNFDDAYNLINFLVENRGFKFSFNGSVPFSFKAVYFKAEEVLNGHIHLEKILQNKYQVIVDINMGGFPLGRAQLIPFVPKDGLSIEEVSCITISHVFKHETVYMKDINDLYYMLQNKNFNWKYFRDLISYYELTDYYNYIYHFLSKISDFPIKNSSNSIHSSLNSKLNMWPYSFKSHFYLKLLFLCTNNKKIFGYKKGIEETIQQLCNNMNLLDSHKYRKICNYMNTRVYLYPILLFNNLLRNIKPNNLIEYIDLNIYKYKNLLILPIGIFMLQDGNESITHHKLNQEISELIEILGVDLTNCDFDFYIESRKDLWLY